MSNRLSGQSSPYLLQHAENPVDWYPWCDEAFARAKHEDKPVFLSVGYSTCHWCHVMAHESFENPKIAEILNRYFISIKVDREERPDIDSVYMHICQQLTGSGGWPMSIFMTAEQKPFFAGTYFPPEGRYGMPGFGELLLAVARRWETNRGELLESAEQIFMQARGGDMHDGAAGGAVANGGENADGSAVVNGSEAEDGSAVANGGAIADGGKDAWRSEHLPHFAAAQFAQSFDERNGGFGAAPKFPVPHNLLFLLLYAHLTGEEAPLGQVKRTLLKMRQGGIFDHIGYGFSRYSTDERFLVPHFEKMLYDNALLIMAYAAAYRCTKDLCFLTTAEQTAEYVLRELTGADGEFFCAQDADSDGEEGKFYVWAYDEILELLGEEKGRAFCAYYGMTRGGNFEGKNIPNRLHADGKNTDVDAGAEPFAGERKLLYEQRRKRGSLHLDDKVLTAWNGLMISAMALLYRVTQKEKYLTAAKRACAYAYVKEHLTEGETLYAGRRGNTRLTPGFLDDYAYFAAAQISLYEATGEKCYLRRAGELCEAAIRQFADSAGGGYFLYGEKNGTLITRPKETYDGALPSGNSVMAWCLVRLSLLCGDERYEELAEKQLYFLAEEAGNYPAGHSVFLLALLMYQKPPMQLTVVPGEGVSVRELIAGLPLYADITVKQEPDMRLNGKTTYYICKNHTCFPPTNDISGI